MGEHALVFFSQQHAGHQAQQDKCHCQERHEGSSLGAAGSDGRVYKVIAATRHLALGVGGLMKVDGYIRQEEAQDEVVNVKA